MRELRVLDCDVCIFGAGAVGLYLADVLSRDTAIRVVLLEAGPERFADRPEPYAVNSLRRTHKGVNEARITAFGGATNTWGGGLIRLSGSDLRPLPGMPESGWPLDYKELSHHYSLVEGDFGLPGETAADAGSRYEAGAAAFRQRAMTVLPFWRKNFARTFGPLLRQRPGVTTVLNVGLPDAVQVSGAGIQCVELRTRGGGLRVAARYYVIAAGIVNSIMLARKLLGLGGKDTGAAIMGGFVHDHISIPLFSIQPSSNQRFSRRFSYRFNRGFMFAERYEAEGLHAGAFFHFTFELSSSGPLAAIKCVLESLQKGAGLDWRALGKMLLGAGTMARIAMTRLFAGRLYLSDDTRVVGVLDLEQTPDAEWRIEPRESPMGCDLSWDIGKADIGNARRYALAVRQLLPQLSREAEFTWKELFPDPEREPEAFEAYVRSTAWDTYHCSGGLRMGSDPQRSAVSPSLSLHGLENVHVVSTAVFPRAGAANPTLTLLALARRLAGQLQSGR